MENLKERVKADKYLTYNEYKKYCEENKIEVDEKQLNKINEEFIERKLIEYKDYFDNMFTDVGEKINLDEEQRRVILSDEEYCLNSFKNSSISSGLIHLHKSFTSE